MCDERIGKLEKRGWLVGFLKHHLATGDWQSLDRKRKNEEDDGSANKVQKR